MGRRRERNGGAIEKIFEIGIKRGEKYIGVHSQKRAKQK